MSFAVLETEQELANVVADEICSLIQRKPNAQICIAAGHSSLGIFQTLTAAYQEGKVDFSMARFTAMDEWKGMNENTKGSCGDFLVQHFVSQVNFAEERICLVDGLASDLTAECKRIHDTIYHNGGLDYLVLGVGMNGHLALNEPGTPVDSGVHVTELDAVTKSVGKKYFTDAPSLEGGVTIGLGDMERAARKVLVVNGSKKAEIVKKIVESEASSSLPATLLKKWSNADIFCDREAAAFIK